MDLGLTEDQEMLKKVAADFVKAEVPAHQMTQWYKNKQTFQPQLVKKAAELGWLGMMLPEEYGGAGVTTMDCAVVFEAHASGDLCEDGVVLAKARVQPGPEAAPTLANDDRATADHVSVVCLDAEPLRIRVAPVARRTLSLFMSHDTCPARTGRPKAPGRKWNQR